MFSSNKMCSASESTVLPVSSELVSDDCVTESREPRIVMKFVKVNIWTEIKRRM